MKKELTIGEKVRRTELNREREACSKMLNLTRADAQLIAGEITEQEWRTVSAVLVALQSRMRPTD